MGDLSLYARQDDCANMARTWRSHSSTFGGMDAQEVLAEGIQEGSLSGTRPQSTLLKPLIGVARGIFTFVNTPVHGSPRARSVSVLGFLLFLSGKVPLFERENHLVNSLMPSDYKEGPWQFEVNRWIPGSIYVLLNIRIN